LCSGFEQRVRAAINLLAWGLPYNAEAMGPLWGSAAALFIGSFDAYWRENAWPESRIGRWARCGGATGR
jgi:hypothetical protein